MPEGSVYICFITPFFFWQYFDSQGQGLWQLINKIHYFDLLFNYLMLTFIYLDINEQLLWLIVKIYSKMTFFELFWDIDSSSQKVSVHDKLNPHNGRQTCVDDANFSSPELHQIWSDWHGIFFVHKANFLLYLNKIWYQADDHRKTLKNGIFRRESAIAFWCHFHGNQAHADLLTWINLLLQVISWFIIIY